IVKTNKLLVVLSGPEPQRSIFEKLILEQLKDLKEFTVLVRGLPLEESVLPKCQNLVVHNYLASHDLSIAIQQADLVLARAGYSTIMDLATLAQKAILVPTPGQAEQEYLAAYLKKQGFFYTCGQGNFNLKKALLEAESFYKKDPPSPVGLNIDVIKNWLEELKRSMALQ
ncbi:MAG: hypothetical protein H7X88_03235, partial [Gloeobacteraceae cyanobacterium ES-bin-316]|nr:hypothetical protein [Ferruginibacter sp.]